MQGVEGMGTSSARLVTDVQDDRRFEVRAGPAVNSPPCHISADGNEMTGMTGKRWLDGVVGGELQSRNKGVHSHGEN